MNPIRKNVMNAAFEKIVLLVEKCSDQINGCDCCSHLEKCLSVWDSGICGTGVTHQEDITESCKKHRSALVALSKKRYRLIK